VPWRDERIRVVKVAGASYRGEALQDSGFEPGRALALLPEPENEYDPNALGIWNEARTLQAGYVPAEVAGAVPHDWRAVSLWEFRDLDGDRIGLRVLLAPPDAWIGAPR
jgi:HIRAN domain